MCAGPVHLQVQRAALDEVARHATVSSPRLMWRMTWTGDRMAAPDPLTSRLGARDVPALQALYADGSPRASRPTSSFPRWWPTACSMESTKAWRWWRPQGRTWWLAGKVSRRLATSTPDATAGDEDSGAWPRARCSATSPASRRSVSTSEPTTTRPCTYTSRSACSSLPVLRGAGLALTELQASGGLVVLLAIDHDGRRPATSALRYR